MIAVAEQETTKDDMVSCEYVATGFWECKDKDGNIWWCDAHSCQRKLDVFGSFGIAHVKVDLLLIRDKETGDIVTAAPIGRPSGERVEIA
jgi:hypothetical protein